MVPNAAAVGSHPQSGSRLLLRSWPLLQSRQGGHQPEEDEATGGDAQGHPEVAGDEKGEVVEFQEKPCSGLESRRIVGRGSNIPPITAGGCGRLHQVLSHDRLVGW